MLRKGFETIKVIQCDPGCNQGTMNERGIVAREVHSIQLLESYRSIISGTPGTRIGKFVNINGALREVSAAGSTPPGSPNVWKVTLHGDDKLPSDLFTPATKLKL